MFNFFNKKTFKLTKTQKNSLSQVLISFNGTFNWDLYDRDNSNVDETGYNEFHQIRSSGEKVENLIIKFLELLEKYPNWSYLLYEIGFSYAYIGDFKNAKIYYDKLLKIEEKGFFNAITESFIIDKIISGDFSNNSYYDYIKIYDTPIGNVVEKEAKKIIKENPNFSPIYISYILSLLINNKTKKLGVVFEQVKKLDLDSDTLSKIKFLEYIYNLFEGKKDLKLLEGISSVNVSSNVNSLFGILYQLKLL